MTIQTMRDFGIGEGQLFVGGRWVNSASAERREIAKPEGRDRRRRRRLRQRSKTPTARSPRRARPSRPGPPDADGARRDFFANWRTDRRERGALAQTSHRRRRQAHRRIAHRRPISHALLLRYAADSARRLQGEILPGEGRDGTDLDSARALRVVAGITAWNFPAALFARKVGPALVTGNTIVVKPHELTPLTTLMLGELSRSRRHSRGRPQRRRWRRPNASARISCRTRTPTSSR